MTRDRAVTARDQKDVTVDEGELRAQHGTRPGVYGRQAIAAGPILTAPVRKPRVNRPTYGKFLERGERCR